MNNRKADPRAAMDYPNLNDSVFVIWSGNEFLWPDSRRRLSYLSRTAVDALKGHALFTSQHEQAATFASEEAAAAWLAEQEAKRGAPYFANITTVAHLKAAKGYTVEG